MPSPKPTDFSLLLEAFNRGLVFGLVSKNDVILWADDIILKTEEPDYFFIEVSLCSNTNNLIEVIGEYSANIDNPICTRVLLGLLYKKLINDNDTLTIETAAKLIGAMQSFGTLTHFEVGKRYSFDDYDLYYPPDLRELQVDIFDFLSIYESFTLNNYSEWAEINHRVELILKHKQAETKIIPLSVKEQWQSNKNSIKRVGKHRLKRKLRISMLVIGIVLLCYLTESSGIQWGSIYSATFICLLLIGRNYLWRGKGQ
jgi:hypothetical protein